MAKKDSEIIELKEKNKYCKWINLSACQGN
jgi:hypothetical protein